METATQQNDVARFVFTGFTFTGRDDSNTHEVEIGTITVENEEFTIHLLRSIALSGKGDFLPAVVKKNGEVIWSFKEECFQGIGKLLMIFNTPMIALIAQVEGKKTIQNVIPLTHLPYRQRVLVYGKPRFNNSREDISETIRYKREVSKIISADISFSKGEAAVIRHWEKMEAERRVAKKKEIEEKKAESERKKAEDRKAKSDRTLKIMSRKRITGYSSDGRTYTGIPVTENEYRCIPNRFPVILVSSFDEASQTIGEMREAFRISKTGGGQIEKANLVSVTAINPIMGRAIATTPEAKQVALFFIGDRICEALVFEDKEALRVARERGLNGGALVTTEKSRIADGSYEVYRIEDGTVNTVGILQPIE